MSSKPTATDLPDVAVVTPLYNGTAWIEATLASVQAQTHAPREVVVVDDGSEDGGLDLIAEVEGVRLLRNPWKGANEARRFGHDQTTAPLLAFLDQDDVWHPDHLRLLATALRDDPGAPAAVCDTEAFDALAPPEAGPVGLDVVPVDPWARYPASFTPTPSGVLIRRTALDAVGGWPTAFVGVADFYTWLRLSERRPLVFNRSTTAWRRVHAASYSRALRTDRTLAYVRSKVEAAHAATRTREAARPDDAEAMELLRRAASALEHAVQAVLADDPEAVSTAASEMEGALDVNGRAGALVGTLAYYLREALAGPGGDSVWGLLLDAWPGATAPRTRRALHQRAVWDRGVGGLARLVARRPMSPGRWRPLAMAVRIHARRAGF